MHPDHQKPQKLNLPELLHRMETAENTEPSGLQRIMGLLRQDWRKFFKHIIAPATDRKSIGRNAAEEPVKRRIVIFFHKLGIEISADSLFKVRLKDNQVIMVIARAYGGTGIAGTSDTGFSLTSEQITILERNGFNVRGGSCITGPLSRVMDVLGER